ncbi:serine hydrolase [Flavobacterium sp.]|uniref:serine hydrolase domain-containing protein n=1 Tax=Flavobacterium sp. TaxID=239 RepID=UPI00122920CD|nr:serine hydrolase [Flavobacterium sp.]RZJ71900.1 MAG: class C beta-lactamase-related serine hydrolase [Flavobacterium sp.]
MKKRYWIPLTFFVLLAIIAFWNYPKLDLISGFAAKNAASCRFIDNRSLETIMQDDNDIPLVNQANIEIDDQSHSVTASVFGLKPRKAVWRQGLGSVLIDDKFDLNAPVETPNRPATFLKAPFPVGSEDQKDTVFPNIDYKKLNSVVASAFDKGDEKIRRSRSVIVIYKDKIIAEKYAPGFSKDSKILGWSMTKSVMATLFGILEKQGKFDIRKPVQIPEWQADDRKKITVENLLRMNSGLEWEENYETISDVTKMLFLSKDMTRAQLGKKPEFKPSEHWNYSSGTSNLLSGVLRKQFKTHQEYLDFWYSDLIDRIGMHSMLVESDMSGNFVGSSYAWATTRDWAKFGLLYLHKGNWYGDQVFDQKWLDFVTSETKGSEGKYGGHFWLNRGGILPNVPRETFSANGFQGQRIFIIPSKNLVIVRMGLTEGKKFDFDTFLKEILASVK